jgi:Skp family chaperone for outer membrane proteins
MRICIAWATCLFISIFCFPALTLAQVQVQGTSIAVIDISFIFKNHALFNGKIEDIKKEIEAFDNYLQEQRTSITQQTEILKSKPPGSPEYQQLEEQIANTHTQLQLETGRKRKEILEREARIYYNAYKDIERHVQEFAYANGIQIVFRYSGEEMDPTKRESVLQGVNRAIVFQDKRDITSHILDALNRRAPAGVSQTPQVPGRTDPTRR